MNLRLSLCVAAAAALLSTSAQAANIFVQDFSNGLGANETMTGRFNVKNGKGGHNDGYTNFEYSNYDLTLDLLDFTDILLSFDYDIQSEFRYDAFNVLASTDGVFNPTKLLTPTTPGFYGPLGTTYARLGNQGLTGDVAGRVTFDLSQFAGQTVKLRFQFQSDNFAFGQGILLDNLKVTGTSAGVPEPATWAMMILGFGAAGASLRRRQTALA